MRTRNKVKSNEGSALVLAILATALLSIVVVTITFQINNQLRFNKRSYDDMQSKYAAEAGIEKSLSEIVRDIEEEVNGIQSMNTRYVKSINHTLTDSCPRVVFYPNGEPFVDQNNTSSKTGFFNLISWQIIRDKIDVKLHAGNVLYEYIRPILGDSESEKLLNYYNNVILYRINDTVSKNGIGYNQGMFKNELDNFLNMIKTYKENIEKSLVGTDFEKQRAISGLNNIIECMLEIKCRLSMDSSVEVPDQDIRGITIPYYEVFIDSNNNLLFRHMDGKPDKSINIEIEYDENKNIIDIDLSNLNSEYLEAISDDYRIRADIDFIFIKNGSTYEIQQRVNSYERIN